ncbi:MAG: hypothetical protein ACI8R4_003713 [Paracoccaceae bacterium]|jgi:hypothetical protein
MTDCKTPQTPKLGIAIGAMLALNVGAFILAAKAWPPVWPGLLLPASLALFCFVWVWRLFHRVQRPLAVIAGLGLGALAAHPALWLPFPFASDLGGQVHPGL